LKEKGERRKEKVSIQIPSWEGLGSVRMKKTKDKKQKTKVKTIRQIPSWEGLGWVDKERYKGATA
jgi:hypothetical protein